MGDLMRFAAPGGSSEEFDAVLDAIENYQRQFVDFARSVAFFTEVND